MTGMQGELAVYKVLGHSIKDMDLSVGRAEKYFHADLSTIGYKAGVKTVEKGKAPVVFKRSYYGEIICVIEGANEVGVCGYASPDVLKTYSCDDLILDQKLRSRGTKTGFYGFGYLYPVRNEFDLLMAIQKAS